MLQMVSGTRAELQEEMEISLARFRYRVFVQELGWPLPTDDELERDAFDRDDTVYVVARNASGEICGCGRLLPTTHPYLLSEVFPELVGDMSLPRASDIWELSRFAISAPQGVHLTSTEAWQNTCLLMANIVNTATQQGAARLIAFSAVGNERLLRRMGVNVHRISTPRLIDGKPVLAFWIEIDDQTKTALGIKADQAMRSTDRPAPSWNGDLCKGMYTDCCRS
ncbi:acyl-homoserine-lactone synthase [Chitinimonas sp. PSY-7]|uniref:acyl-homoserine-lactone synthase n=1 Tax=Chitinimonas sp. PSY-7 TaxID=3459088 RepID=UPI00403FE609